jgi:hypothetical protein
MITFTTRPTRGPSERSFGDFVQVPSRRNRGRRRPRAHDQQPTAEHARVQRAPVKQAPVKQAPVKQEPVKQEHVKQEPVKQAPVEQAPVKQEPVKQPPGWKPPVQQAPIKKTLPLDAISHIWYNSEIEERLKARGIKLWSDDPDNM